MTNGNPDPPDHQPTAPRPTASQSTAGQPTGPPAGSHRLPAVSEAVLRRFLDGGFLGSTEVHLIASVARLSPEAGPLALLALAVASRGARQGHACIGLLDIGQTTWSRPNPDDSDQALAELPWPEPDLWSAELRSSPIVSAPADVDNEPIRPLVFDGERVYLQRYWTHETRVADDLTRRAAVSDIPHGLDDVLEILFTEPGDSKVDSSQRRAVKLALSGGLSIITGGPGTGKTFTIARILSGAHRLAESHDLVRSVALAAPTGKAAARITESVGVALSSIGDSGSAFHVSEATTIHALLGWASGDGFRHNRRNLLPYDMVIIDETSMVSLSLMARLLEAVRPDASLILVGDPDQLASVEVGTVLSDIIGPASVGSSDPLSNRITELTSSHRFGGSSPIAQLAMAIRAGQTDAVLAMLNTDTAATTDSATENLIEWIRPDDVATVDRLVDEVVDASVLVAEAALTGDAEAAIGAAMSTKVLAAIHRRPFGLHYWSDLIEDAVAERVDIDDSRRWFVGRPVMITANDRVNRVANGDIGVVISRDGSMVVALPEANDIRYLPTSRLSEVATWWAMTIHKSQGSEFDHDVVSLPPAGSPVLSRELLYTAVTRARKRVTILADEATLREAIATPISRASGLRSRLWPTA